MGYVNGIYIDFQDLITFGTLFTYVVSVSESFAVALFMVTPQRGWLRISKPVAIQSRNNKA